MAPSKPYQVAPGSPAHQVWLDHIGNQKWVANCTCGWRGRQQNGKAFWSRAEAFASILGHAAAHPEIDLSRPSVIDSTKVERNP